MQFGLNDEEAKVFRAHPVQQGLCEHLINALKLLANEQTDHNSTIRSIVTGFMKKSRKRHMNGLRNFIEADNHSAVDVGSLAQRHKAFFYVQKPNCSEDYPEAAIRERADELTLRADEVGTQRAFIHIDHIEDDRWRPPGIPSAKQFSRNWRGRMGRFVMSLQRDEQGNRSQKAK